MTTNLGGNLDPGASVSVEFHEAGDMTLRAWPSSFHLSAAQTRFLRVTLNGGMPVPAPGERAPGLPGDEGVVPLLTVFRTWLEDWKAIDVDAGLDEIRRILATRGIYE